MPNDFFLENGISIPKVLLPLLLQEITADGIQRNLVALTNNSGFIYTPDEVKDLLQGLMDFYNSDGIAKWIENENKHTRLQLLLKDKLKKLPNGKYALPEPEFKIKPFREDLLRHWSFECDWCGRKVSSKKDKNYYLVNDSVIEISGERACSEVCAKHIWYEGVNIWLNKHGFKDYFEE